MIDSMGHQEAPPTAQLPAPSPPSRSEKKRDWVQQSVRPVPSAGMKTKRRLNDLSRLGPMLDIFEALIPALPIEDRPVIKSTIRHLRRLCSELVRETIDAQDACAEDP